MSDRVRGNVRGSEYAPHPMPLTYDFYSCDDREASRMEQPPLRRHGASVPVPHMLASVRSTTSRSTSSFGKKLNERYPSAAEAPQPAHVPTTRDIRTASPPCDERSSQLSRTQLPEPASRSSRISAPGVAIERKSRAIFEHSGGDHWPGNSISDVKKRSVAEIASLITSTYPREDHASAAPSPLLQQARRPSSRIPAPDTYQRNETHPPRPPKSRAARSFVPGAANPGVMDASSAPLTISTKPPSRPPPERLVTQSQRQQGMQAPESVDHLPISQGSTAGVEISDRSAADTFLAVKAALTTAGAKREAEKKSLSDEMGVNGYVAQTVFTQRNLFRTQEFAAFITNPQYQPPREFLAYPRLEASRAYGFEASRANQEKFMMHRLMDAVHSSTREERTNAEMLSRAILEKLQVGDWFYKWTQSQRVHQRYVRLNPQCGTLTWAPSPRGNMLLKSEVKLSHVSSLTADCLQSKTSSGVFYRMSIQTPGRCIRLATEIRHKFDLWYGVLQQLTAPNSTYGALGLGARPSSSVDMHRGGRAGRWDPRYIPQDAVMGNTSGGTRPSDLYASRVVSSSE